MEAGGDGDRPGPVRRTLRDLPGPLRVVGDGLTSVSVHVHPDAPGELLLGLGEARVAALESILYGETGEVNAGTDDSLVVVRIDANTVSLQVKCVLTILDIL